MGGRTEVREGKRKFVPNFGSLLYAVFSYSSPMYAAVLLFSSRIRPRAGDEEKNFNQSPGHAQSPIESLIVSKREDSNGSD